MTQSSESPLGDIFADRQEAVRYLSAAGLFLVAILLGGLTTILQAAAPHWASVTVGSLAVIAAVAGLSYMQVFALTVAKRLGISWTRASRLQVDIRTFYAALQAKNKR